MTGVEPLFDSLERDIARFGWAADGSCSLHQSLPTPLREALLPAMRFLSCESWGCEGTKLGEAGAIDRAARRRIARLILCRLHADTDDPRWSSAVLEDAVDATLVVPGADWADVFSAVVDLWERNDVSLTVPVGNLIADLGSLCFRSRYRDVYRRSDLAWLADRVLNRPASPTAYLAARVLPAQHTIRAKTAILSALEGTPFHREVAALYEGG